MHDGGKVGVAVVLIYQNKMKEISSEETQIFSKVKSATKPIGETSNLPKVKSTTKIIPIA